LLPAAALTAVEAWVAVRDAAALLEARVGAAVALPAAHAWPAAAALLEARVGAAVALSAAHAWPATAAVWVAPQGAAGLAEWVLSAAALACFEVGQDAVARSEVDPVWLPVDPV
jgi:hypothetical protein